MASDIKTYASSTFSEMSRYMSSSTKKEKIHIYVEDDLDKAFWSNLFKSFYGDKYRLVISLYHNVSDDSIPGKDAMLKAVKDRTFIPNSRQLCCVDADYDLLIDVPDKYSKIVRENLYVVHTCMYSMENIKCFPSKIYNDIAYRVSLPDDEITFDFDKCIEDISEVISDLVILTIVSKKLLDTELSVDDLSSFVRDNLTFDTSHHLTTDFRNAVESEIKRHQPYITSHSQDIQQVKQDLLNRNITSRHFYEIMQGHMLLDHIAVPIIVHVVQPIRNRFYSSLNGTSEQNAQAANHYAHNTGVHGDDHESLKQRVTSLLRDNYHINGIATVSEIKAQFDKALQPRASLLNVMQTLIEYKVSRGGIQS